MPAAFGVVFELSDGILYLPGDGLTTSFNELFKIRFGTVKILVDTTLVPLAALSSLLILGNTEGARGGRCEFRVLVGRFVKRFRPVCGVRRL